MVCVLSGVLCSPLSVALHSRRRAVKEEPRQRQRVEGKSLTSQEGVLCQVVGVKDGTKYRFRLREKNKAPQCGAFGEYLYLSQPAN